MFKKKIITMLLLSIIIFTHINLNAMEESKMECVEYSPSKILPKEIFGMVLLHAIKASKNLEEAICTIKYCQFSDKHTQSVVETLLNNPIFIKEVKRITLMQHISSSINFVIAKFSIKKMLNPSLTLEAPLIALYNTFEKTYQEGQKKLAKFYYFPYSDKQMKNSFFHQCSYDNDLNMTAFCLRHQADVNVIINDSTALMNAVQNNKTEMIKLLLSFNADKNITIQETRRFGIGAPLEKYEKTAFSIAKHYNNTAVLEILENNSQS